ncbi:MAG: BLUF domain-containing protein [Roseivirga sp.]
MLFELIYRSEADTNVSDDDLLNILSKARSFNGEHELTGCLLYNNRHFVQILEGEFNTLNELYARIRQDNRHHNVVTLHMKEIETRAYPDWTMAFKSLEAEDMRSIKNALGISQFKELNSVNEESPISKQLFWMVTQAII